VKSISYTKSFEIKISIANLFPLFSPEGEKQWVPGWDYENVMGISGEMFVSEFSESVYNKFIGEWQKLLSKYIQKFGT
jgi:hypothetical protein